MQFVFQIHIFIKMYEVKKNLGRILSYLKDGGFFLLPSMNSYIINILKYE